MTEPNLNSSLQLDVLILLSNSSLLNTVSLFSWLAIVVTARNELNAGSLDTATMYCDFENRASCVRDIWDSCEVFYLYFNLLKCDAAWFRSDLLPPLIVLENKNEWGRESSSTSMELNTKLQVITSQNSFFWRANFSLWLIHNILKPLLR